MRSRWIALAVAVVVVAALIVWAARPDPVPAEVLSPRVDSTRIAEQAVKRALDSVTVVIAAERDSVRTANEERARRIATLEGVARSASERADRMADVARSTGDTASAAWAAYMAANERGNALAAALAASDSALRAERALAERFRVANDSALAHGARLAAVATELRDAVDRADRRNRCRIIGAIPCPSRTVVAVAGAAAGFAGAIYLDR